MLRRTFETSLRLIGSNLLFSLTFKGFLAVFFVSLIFASSVGLYSIFYWVTVPKPEHILQLHLEHRRECTRKPGDLICSFPSASIHLGSTRDHELDQGHKVFAFGQDYKIELELDMPPSSVNRMAGMFMVDVSFRQKEQKRTTSSRSIMFPYTSDFISTIKAIALSGLYLLRLVEEKEVVRTVMFDHFRDNSFSPVHTIEVTIHAKHIEIYEARLRISANFSGIRYFMFYWPVTSALIGICACLSLVSLIGFWIYVQYSNSSRSTRFNQNYFSRSALHRQDVLSRQSHRRLRPRRSSSLTELREGDTKRHARRKSVDNRIPSSEDDLKLDDVDERIASTLKATRRIIHDSRDSAMGVSSLGSSKLLSGRGEGSLIAGSEVPSNVGSAFDDLKGERKKTV